MSHTPNTPKLGRPPKYTEELATEICRRIASGETLRQICRDPAMPARQTVVSWLLDNNNYKTFLDRYTAAREQQADVWHEEMLDIADDGSNDWIERETKHGVIDVPDHEHINRSRLRVDTRKWIIERASPKKYGVPGSGGGNVSPPTIIVLRTTAPQAEEAALNGRIVPDNGGLNGHNGGGLSIITRTSEDG